ncbi:MAG: thioredoxin family protein [Candidatus Fermentithermobacillus carboniphilus]|uniref:Thioredoxin family protein n=1 Tax=Candidatus Fermentithermobacillus carboniphilus TaxID=3085328 RepID=A0AAT9LCW9_9FIRM|nr:MAG: thioredoxin family protein [Candidatus Fermentithermobacillus carboniphilus]
MEKDWLQRGLSFFEYLDRADMNVPTMKENYAETAVSPEDHKFFEGLCRLLPEGAIKILAISEPWCGDCVENLPVVAKLAALYPVFRLYVFSRDDNLDIMDMYLTDGKRTIPVFVFFDEGGEEIGRFVERPEGAHRFLREEMKTVEGLPEDERKRRVYEIRQRLRKMYKEGLRDETIREIRKILERRYGYKDS